MYCPSCGRAVLHHGDLTHGTHVEDHCVCGQRLQWDQPIKAITRTAFLIGAPQPCVHGALRHPEALFPCVNPPKREGQTGREEESHACAAGASSEA